MPEEEDFVRLKARPVKCRVAISSEHTVAEIVKSTQKHKEKHKESEVSRYYFLVVDAITSFTPIRNAPAVAAAAAKAPPVRTSD
jgi:hypothetical protein